MSPQLVHKMRLSPSLATAAALLVASAQGSPLLGYGSYNYDTPCFYACNNAIPTSLNCPEYAELSEGELAFAYPSATCFGNDTAYLTSIAWCIKEHCDESVKIWEVEKFWAEDLFYGSTEPGVVIRYTYSEAIEEVDTKNPPQPMGTDLVLNRTISLTDDEYIAYLNSIMSFKITSKNESKFS
ncbi:hypothetical protein AUP68_16041 [Ilyonectria robusta]